MYVQTKQQNVNSVHLLFVAQIGDLVLATERSGGVNINQWLPISTITPIKKPCMQFKLERSCSADNTVMLTLFPLTNVSL